MEFVVPAENIRRLIYKKDDTDNDSVKYSKRRRFSTNTVVGDRKIQNNFTLISAKRCLLPRQKSPTPKLKDIIRTPVNPCKNEKNYVKENILHVKNMTYEEKPHIIQDSCDGHRQDVNRAGLELKYVFKKEYGKTPGYIHRNRHLLKEVEQRARKETLPKQGTRYVSDEEKDDVLNGLHKNLKEAEKKLLSLPVVTDTISKRNRKIYLENLIIKLQQDIEILDKHDIIIISD